MRDRFEYALPVPMWSHENAKCYLPYDISWEEMFSPSYQEPRHYGPYYAPKFVRGTLCEALARRGYFEEGVASHVRFPKDITCEKSRRRTYANIHGFHD